MILPYKQYLMTFLQTLSDEDTLYISSLLEQIGGVCYDNCIHFNDYIHSFLGICGDINYIELCTVDMALQHIVNRNHPFLNYAKLIHIITDNQQTFYWLSGDHIITDPYIYDIILNCYKLISIIAVKFKINVEIQWCRGHRADILAKIAISQILSQINVTNNSSINTTTPLSIQIIKRKFKWMIQKIMLLNKQHTRIEESIHVISQEMDKWGVYQTYNNKHLNEDILIVPELYYSILRQLRTGHIKLNLCMHQLNHMNYYKLQMDKFGDIKQYLECDDQCCAGI